LYTCLPPWRIAMVMIPDKFQYLLARGTKAFAALALTRADGSPHVSPVWFDWDGTRLIINTARGRVKDRILQKKPKVALSIVDPADPYRYVLIRGQVDGETEEGGYEMICSLNEKYKGKYEYPRIPGQVRVTYTILPEYVFTSK
ncbi:MAG: PPOX class F420-dependent oxidoreductase, partial [Anaerolineales bacterium]